MFRLNEKKVKELYDFYIRFNTSYVSVEYIKNPQNAKAKITMFQYFKCFGWIIVYVLFLLRHTRFNTSNVSVEWIKNFFNNFFWNLVSILQMFRLNSVVKYFIIFSKSFQYFKCFGWIRLEGCIWRRWVCVSILQMFRLNLRSRSELLLFLLVSILQMFRLN